MSELSRVAARRNHGLLVALAMAHPGKAFCISREERGWRIRDLWTGETYGARSHHWAIHLLPRIHELRGIGLTGTLPPSPCKHALEYMPTSFGEGTQQ